MANGNSRGSEYSPTFVNYGGSQGSGATATKGPRATDLHIVFKKGGVEVKDAPNAEEIDRKTTEGNQVDIIFKSPIESAGPQPNPPEPTPGSDYVPPREPPGGTTYNPKFAHSDPTFPGIKEWWWTHKKWVAKRGKRPAHWETYEGDHHTGSPSKDS
jgi:hypothetical protein